MIYGVEKHHQIIEKCINITDLSPMFSEIIARGRDEKAEKDPKISVKV
jgi:hypothetical protein